MKPEDMKRELRELALDSLFGTAAEREAARRRLAADPAGESARVELARRLGESADSLCAARLPSPREARLVARVLARTTRQDPSWRGDVRLLADFLRARLRQSRALRFVAAALALHVIAAPAVALWIFWAPPARPSFTLHVELAEESPFAPEPPPVRVTEPDALRDAARRQEAEENELARERFQLQRLAAHVPALPAAADEPIEARLLHARARLLRETHEDGIAEDAVAVVSPQDLDPLALALWVELELDRKVLLGAEAPELERAARTLALAAADPQLAARQPGTAALARAACARAAALGVRDGTPGESALVLLGEAWFAALARAGEENRLAPSPAWNAWLAWRER